MSGLFSARDVVHVGQLVQEVASAPGRLVSLYQFFVHEGGYSGAEHSRSLFGLVLVVSGVMGCWLVLDWLLLVERSVRLGHSGH